MLVIVTPDGHYHGHYHGHIDRANPETLKEGMPILLTQEEWSDFNQVESFEDRQKWLRDHGK